MRVHNFSKIMKRVLLTLLIFVLSFSVVSMIVTVIFFHTAFPRSDSLSDTAYTYVQISHKGYPYRQVSFTSGKNTLSGYCFTPHRPQALVVIAAGFRESGAEHLSEMMSFVDSGYAVLCYDATGVGESEGDSTVGLTQPSLDLRAALSYVSSDPLLQDLPILLYGYSAGGYAVATCSDDPSVKAAVVISGFESPTLLMRETARNYVSFLADIEYPFLSLGNMMIFSAEGDQRASRHIAEAAVPVLIYEGAKDKIVPEAVRLSRFVDEKSDLTLRIVDEPDRSGHKDILCPGGSSSADADMIAQIISFYKSAE